MPEPAAGRGGERAGRRAGASPGERGRERAFDVLLWLLLCVPVLLTSDPNDGGSWTRVAVGVVLLAVCTALARRWPVLPLALTVAVSLALAPELFTPSYVPALIAFGALAGRRQDDPRWALGLFAAVPVAGLVLVLASGKALFTWFGLLLSLALAVVAPWLIGRYARQYDRLVRSGWELADRMEREQAAVADRERLRERSRIAGDMHDSLGHDLALLALRAGALELDPALGPEQRRAAGELRRAAADATGRLRDIIGVLREEDDEASVAPVAPPDETVADLVDRARASGMAVTLVDAAEPPAEMTARALRRVVQEGLTNAAKHAPGAPVAVTVERDAALVRVRVTSGPRPASSDGTGRGGDGPGPAGAGAGPGGTSPSGLASGGTGLVGLDERVRLAGGSLRHGPTGEGGFALSAVLPLDPPAPRPAAPRSARELDLARRQVRRGLARAIWIPLALLAALGLLMAGVAVYTQHQTYLEPEDYARIRTGQSRAEIAAHLPDHPLDGRPARVPAEPAGMDECLYYRSELLAALPVYRLCFVDGHLADRAELP
ncbi:sensor histidine kinase [Streptomyces sp. NPDC053493]|uniref:sensor histidine kinase n=1 Tax=Streptomyces sp. NPDC053493 TaxID=3365705 RepID=UPI0037D5F5CA